MYERLNRHVHTCAGFESHSRRDILPVGIAQLRIDGDRWVIPKTFAKQPRVFIHMDVFFEILLWRESSDHPIGVADCFREVVNVTSMDAFWRE